MTVQELAGFYRKDNNTSHIAEELGKVKSARIHLKGICGSADALIANAIIENQKRTQLFILSEKEEAAYFLNDLEALGSKSKVIFFPAPNRHPYHEAESDNANTLLRAEVLSSIRKPNVVIVTYPEALSEKVITKTNLQRHTLQLKKGDKLSLDFISELLSEYDFECVDYVSKPGQFSVRGGIVDMFSYSNEYPYRVEFFGEEVESIREFDTATQLSRKNLARISIIPDVRNRLLKEGNEPFLDFLPGDTVIWLKDLELVNEKIEKELERAKEVFRNLESPAAHLPPEELYIGKAKFTEQVQRFSTIEFGNRFHFKPDLKIRYKHSPQPSFNKNFDLLCKNLEKNAADGIKNVIAAASSKQIERLYAVLEDKAKTDKVGEGLLFTPILLALREGFTDKDLKLSCYTDHQLFERYHRFRLKEGFAKAQQTITLKELTDMKKGDFVTHIDHGIGVFDGLEKLEVKGKPQEALRLIYKNNDILYVSIHSLHRISKYSGKEGGVPKISKLGSKAWQRLKQKTKKKVKEIAFDLIKLYAKRKAQQGFQFAPDTYLQNELEASFIYEDTPDQVKSTLDVKNDMEAPHPMDRLICGDVGFGKTEIAIRAAFKAVTDSKQVAILAPTTILTLQHYHTFSARLKDFPCNIDYINRFKSTKQQKETLRKLESGETDIIIGTHRLIGKDVKFKDIGLLILDEEQKFGVSAKDKLKTVKVNVDTLTLTATPIPRTLQFSLLGARDLSIINTPPPNRYPVQTELHIFNVEVIRNAIHYEVSRNGQVFFVHDKVANIEEVAEMIQRLCPDVKTGVAHGQMDGQKLEKIMMRFIEGEFDVLVSTTIIESGLDISNANTIIINQAQMYGLSDLHQMRGRVGRSNKRAFCYLLAPPLSSITPEARQRLTAIEQFSELGSGFSIAMRDLDIRGAGNMLGAEQSGFIAEIGFDTYHKILEEAIEELKEEEFKELFKKEEAKVFVKDCQIETDLEILLPEDYVNVITERLSLYRTLGSIETEDALLQFEQNLEDRFGELPTQTKDLLNTIRLRWLAKRIGFEKILLKSGKLIGYFAGKQDSPYFQSELFTKVLNYIQAHPGSCEMKEKKEKLSLVFSQVQSIDEAIEILEPILADEVIC